jgi:M6 family metalloprotease-like protein
MAVLALGAAVSPRALPAQDGPVREWEPRGFDFTPDGVWRRKAAAVAAARAAALARGDFASLNAPMAMAANVLAPGAVPFASMMAVSGVLREPVFIVRFKNTDTTQLHTPAEYNDDLLNVTPMLGRPYTVNSFYDEMSNHLLSIQGQILGWVTLDSTNGWYAGNCNGLCTSGHVAGLMAEAVTKSDTTVDFGQFDNDGPDGIPNSGDDDGFVDLAVFIHPELDGACGPSQAANPDIWSHRFYYAGWTGGFLTTNDTSWANMAHTVMKGLIRVNNYTIQSGVGGATACDPSNIMAIGTMAHETGHAFGLPDFYDTNPTDGDNSEGIGHWGLMSSGNYMVPPSPAHMEGFSRMQLGWVTVRDLAANGTYTLGPYTVGDTIFRITPPGTANSRGEYYLIENRQGTLGDSALVNAFYTQNGKPKGPGLLVWHVDPVQYANGLGLNQINTGPIHALKLEQADGLDNLGSSVSGIRNRGDGGDPYPGSSNNPSFGTSSTPRAMLNSGNYAGFVLDSIRQVVSGGEMAFRLRFGFPVFFATSGSGTVTASNAMASGDLLPVNDSVTLTSSAGAGLTFGGWTGDTTTNNAVLKLRTTHGWTVTAVFQSAIAVLDSALRAPRMGVSYLDTLTMSGGNGFFNFTLQSGSTLPPGLTLAPTGVVFGVPAKDSTYTFTVHVTSGPQSSDLALRLAVSAPTLTVTNVVNQLLGVAAPLTSDEVRYLDLLGNRNNQFDLGDFMAWLDHTGNMVSADVTRRIMTRSGQ